MLTYPQASWLLTYFGPFALIGVSEALDQRTQGKKQKYNKKHKNIWVQRDI